MSKLNYTEMDGISFELYVMDLCEKAKPTTAEDLSILSGDLHQRIEVAIEDYIRDESLEGEYESQY